MYRKIMTKICVVWSQGCISVSFQFHRTSFCFVCSHLASGEKEGDELRRNLDVIEILKNTQFPRICRPPYSRIPEKILDHEWVYFSWINAWTAPSIFIFIFLFWFIYWKKWLSRIIWLGDLNYRISLSYSDTRKLLDAKNWDALFDNDQVFCINV